jgi:hypothetical protein
MKNTLPNYELAIISEEKLLNYCLNSEHPVGKNKARVFKAALGWEQKDFLMLKNEILAALPNSNAEITKEDKHGIHYRIVFEVENEIGNAVILTGWIIEIESKIPRLTTCYIP